MKLALGTVQFGMAYGIANSTGQVSRLRARDILQLAADNGIDTLDTAIAYGDSENCLGEAGASGFKIVTKLPAIPDDCSDVFSWVHEQVAGSLTRLRVASVYGLLLHRAGQLLSPMGMSIFKAMLDLRAAGLVKKIGISIYSPFELEELASRYDFDLVQAPFSLVDRRLVTSGWLQRLKSEGIEVHTRSTFMQGLLLMPKDEIPVYFKPWENLWSIWHKWLENNTGYSAVQACLSYPLAFKDIDRVVVGCETYDQIQQLLNLQNENILVNYPEIQCEDERLVNPVNWNN